MANTYHQIYLQTVFAVKYRNARILIHYGGFKVQGVIGNLINETGCKTIIVNGVEDHMHCFLGLKPVVSVSELLKTVKAKSSKYINDHNLTKDVLNGRKGMESFLMAKDVDQMYESIIKNQEVHHQKRSFQR